MGQASLRSDFQVFSARLGKSAWLLLLAFGLASCQSDKPAGGTVDKWNMELPMIQAPGLDQKPLALTTIGANAIPVDAKVVFTALAANDEKSPNFETVVESTCTHPSAPEQAPQVGTARFADQTSYKFSDLLPEEALLTLQPHQALRCTFFFTMKNQYGSVRRVTVPGIEFSHLERLENWELPTKSNLGEFGLGFKGQDFKNTPLPTNEAAGSSVKLFCDHFRNDRVLLSEGEAISQRQILNELTTGAIEPNSNLLLAPTDTRLTFNLQTCRVLYIKITSAQGRERFLTPAFVFQFPSPPLQVVPSLGLGHAALPTLNGDVFYSIDLNNPNAFPVAYRFTDIDHDFTFSPVFGDANRDKTARTNGLNFANWATGHTSHLVIGATRTIQESGFFTVEVPPNGHVEVRVLLSTELKCPQIVPAPMFADAPMMLWIDLLGYQFQLTSPSVERLLNWQNDGDLASPRQPLQPLPFFGKKGNVPFWRPNQSGIDSGLQASPPPTMLTIGGPGC
jgi:hypothetical protein